MSQKYWLVVLFSTTLLAVLWVGYLVPDAPEQALLPPPEPTTASVDHHHEMSRPTDASEPEVMQPLDSGEASVAVLAESAAPVASTMGDVDDPVLASLLATSEPPGAMQAAWAEVAAAYEVSARYPSYSIPLSSDLAVAYRGNAFEPISLPLVTGAVMRVTLPQLRYPQGEPVPVRAEVQGAAHVDPTMHARLIAVRDETEVASAELRAASPGELFQGQISTDDLPAGEYRLIVRAYIDQEAIQHVSPLMIEPEIGQVLGLGVTSVAENHLVVPVRFEAHSAGRYAVSANLFTGGQPIAHLTAEANLVAGEGDIPMRVYGSLLVGQNLGAGLHLMDVQVRRLPARPGVRTAYGFGASEGYAVAVPSLDTLEDLPYHDELTQQRIDFLRSLGSQ